MKSWPKVKLGPGQVGSNIAQKIGRSPVDQCVNVLLNKYVFYTKLTISEIRSSYYWLQFGFIYPYLAPKHNFCSYLALFTYIYHYLPIIGPIQP